MITTRLPIPAARIADVAAAALVDIRTVRHYRERWPLLRATEAAITRAVRALPADPQMEIPVVRAGPARVTMGPVKPLSSDAVGSIPTLPTKDTAPPCLGSSPSGGLGRGPHSSAASEQAERYPLCQPRCAPPIRRMRIEIGGRSMTVEELAQYEPGAT